MLSSGTRPFTATNLVQSEPLQLNLAETEPLQSNLGGKGAVTPGGDGNVTVRVDQKPEHLLLEPRPASLLTSDKCALAPPQNAV